MKKALVITFTLCVGLLYMSCNRKNKNAAAHILPPANTFTLNGIPSADADQMISFFQQNRGHFDANNFMCEWFSKAQLLTMYGVVKALKNPIGDGIRLYFARTSLNGPYTIVAVATTEGILDTIHPDGKRHIHNEVFQAQNPFPVGIAGMPPTDPTQPQEGELLFNSSSPCQEDTCSPAIQRQPHYLTCAIARQMVYRQRDGDTINSKSEWFDIGLIQSLITAIPDGGGLRVYFARHLQPGPSDSLSRHGFVLIVTEKSATDNGQIDQFPCIPIITFYHEYKYNVYSYDGGGGGADNGEQCPTNCTGTTLP